TVDQPAIATLPQDAREPKRRPHDDDVIDFVEIPLVEQEWVQHLVLACEFDRYIWPTDIELPGDQEAADHHRRRQQADPQRNVVHLLEYVIVRTEFQRLAEEMLDAMTGEQVDEGIAGEDRTGRQHRERDQHDLGAFMRVLVMLAIVRLAPESL